MRDPFDPKTPPTRSVSQLKQFEKCAYSYFLARIREPRAWQRPAAWLPQGSAVHSVAEEYRRRELAGNPMTLEEAQNLFRMEYAKEIAEYTAITPNFEWWSKSGPYNAKRDIPRRYQIGLEQVEKFINWTTNNDHEVIWIAPDGTPGIELRFNIDLDGVPVLGFIDAVIERWTKDGRKEMVVRDYKTGNQPGDDFQLGVYGLALAETFGIEQPSIGDYWMGKPGKPTWPYDISEWTRDKVTEKFHELEENIQAGNFEPSPTVDGCKFCDVSDACEYRMA